MIVPKCKISASRAILYSVYLNKKASEIFHWPKVYFANGLLMYFRGKMETNIRVISDFRIQKPFTLRQVYRIAILITTGIGLLEP